MHTPEQAKALWCPMVRASNGEDQSANAGNSEEYRTPSYAHCIADKCAMWRWEPNQGDLINPGASGFIPARGYCGLAGSPAA